MKLFDRKVSCIGPIWSALDGGGTVLFSAMSCPCCRQDLGFDFTIGDFGGIDKLVLDGVAFHQ